jgi:hypothetical protein
MDKAMDKADIRSLKLLGCTQKQWEMAKKWATKNEKAFKYKFGRKNNNNKKITSIPSTTPDPGSYSLPTKKLGYSETHHLATHQWHSSEPKFIHLCNLSSHLRKNTIIDLKATGLFFEISARLGFQKDSGKKKDIIDLRFQAWWDLSIINDQWWIKRPLNTWNTDLHWIYPNTEATYDLFLGRLMKYGLQEVIDDTCRTIKSDWCTIWMLSFIAISETSKEYAPSYHVDFPEVTKTLSYFIPLQLPVTLAPELLFVSGEQTKPSMYR